MRLYFIVVFMFLVSCTHAQTYEGNIGKYPILLELEINQEYNDVFAYYFYKSQLKNISFTGSYDDSTLILDEILSEKQEKELFTLSINKDSLNGIWKYNGRSHQVKLSKTSKNSNDFKLKRIEFIRDSITNYHKKELVWFTEKHSKTYFFRLGNGFTKQQRDVFNPILDSIHVEHAITSLDCSWADIGVEIELVSEEYVSYKEFSSIYCGGAHPNHTIAGLNFDLKRLKQLDSIQEIYPNLVISELVKNKYKDEEGYQNECEHFAEENKDAWKYANWFFTKKGIMVVPSYVHAMTHCREEFLVPYDVLKKASQ
ncbi:hypothetical protein ABW636_14615 [Aquimarina sp. 2201CG1-2-11]|uniref:hypothetical protein n=1 Tax=Aquimarina discodermiae TaxID=3231043 RepID=UPI003461FE20